jgi:hypothetical protein
MALTAWEEAGDPHVTAWALVNSVEDLVAGRKRFVAG